MEIVFIDILFKCIYLRGGYVIVSLMKKKICG